jgi:hypothetical protein
MAGTIPLSMTQQLDEFGQPLSGGQLFIIQAGTVNTPQNPFQDTGLTLTLPNPMTLDAAGRIPQFFLADGQIKVRLQDVNGVVKFVQDNILVIGPSAGGGGGGGGTVDPTTVLQTGDMKFRYDTSILSGFVRSNGNTIGSSSSGATELADPSAQALFSHLWLKDPLLVVSPGGRGVSAAADWTANKQIATPDFRGYAVGGLDTMGAAPAGRLSAAYFGSDPTVLGAVGGGESLTLGPTQIPAHQHPVFLRDPGHAHGVSGGTSGTASGPVGVGTGAVIGMCNATGININPNTTGITIGSSSGANDNQTAIIGGGQAHRTVGPRKLITFYLKL